MVGTRTRTKAAVAGALILLAGSGSTALAGAGGVERAALNSYGEVPTLSTAGAGAFSATVNTTTSRIVYTLRYSRLSANVQQAHIHLGRAGTVGGVSAFLCSNLTGAPAGTPACPARAGTVRNVVTRAEVIGPADQGINARQFNELVQAVRRGATYVNVHTVAFPSGEIRGQIR
jgi:hypothetical protein